MAKLTKHTELILPKESTVAFTGYRASKMIQVGNRSLEAINHTLKHRLDVVIRHLYHSQGYSRFIQGMQSGLDLNAALSVSDMRSNGYDNFQLYGAIPFDEFCPEKKWIDVYQYVHDRCDDIFVFGTTPSKQLYLKRNDFMLSGYTTKIDPVLPD